MREIKLFHSPASEHRDGNVIVHHPDEWRVEELDADGDGGVAMAIFTGPHAEERARRYADRLRNGAA